MEKKNEAFDQEEGEGSEALPGYMRQEPSQNEQIARDATGPPPDYPQQQMPQQPQQWQQQPPQQWQQQQPQQWQQQGGVVMMQPMPSNVMVVSPPVVVQDEQIMKPETKEWSTGLCGFCDDFGICCLVWLCPYTELLRLANRLDESCLVPCWVPGSLVVLRTKLRIKLGIKGSICNDCIAAYCCYQCVMCQMHREMSNAGIPRGGCC